MGALPTVRLVPERLLAEKASGLPVACFFLTVDCYEK